VILVIETSGRKNSLHFLEFVKPVTDILESVNTVVTVAHYTELTPGQIETADRIIICGNGLQDQDFLKATRKFSWLRDCRKPVLGICAGMQMIAKVFGATLKKSEKIGMQRVNFLEPDTLLSKMSGYNVYELHTKVPGVPYGFVELAETDIPMAFRKTDAPIYGLLWHPEVSNKELIKAFATVDLG
jgi:GMP synthase-like glutamine amidotransferase